MRFWKKIPGLLLFLMVLALVAIAAVFLIVVLNLPLPVAENSQEVKIPKGSLFQNLFFKKLPSPTVAPSPSPVLTPTLTPKQVFNSVNQKYGPCYQVPVLMYHHLLPAAEAKAKGAEGLNVTPEVFEEQIDYLTRKGYQTIFLEELMDGIKGNRTLPSKPLIITFDDGYRELYYTLFPLIKNKNFKATIFVISQFADGADYLRWPELKEMANTNLLEIGDHTLTHQNLTETLPEAVIRDQIISSQRIISERSGRPVKVFAYPYGTYNKTVEKILDEGNFLAAVKSTNTGYSCAELPYEVPRIRIGNASLSNYGL